jgi:hypothetical protein
MIFRGIDTENKGEVGWFEFSNFLREVMSKHKLTKDWIRNLSILL